jgi:hypothetical protein
MDNIASGQEQEESISWQQAEISVEETDDRGQMTDERSWRSEVRRQHAARG